MVFVSIDDLNDWVGVLGSYPGVITPNIDRLAARGMLFRRAYCAAPSCNASRTALLTGVQPYDSSVYTSNERLRDFLPGATTLPEYFRINGYLSAGAGKVFHHHDPQSWDEYLLRPTDPLPSQSPANGLPCASGTSQNPAFILDWAPLSIPVDQMSDAQVVDWAVDYLARTPVGQRFFLGVGLFRPHVSWFVPQEYFDMYPLNSVVLPQVLDTDLDDVPPVANTLHPGVLGTHACLVSNNGWREAVQAYLASITFADAMLGRLLDALENGPHNNSTIVVLWSDHGYHLGEKLLWHKRALWEEATRVPLIIRAPGITTPGDVCDSPVGLIDLYATLVELCGLPALNGIAGQSLVPLLTNPALNWPQPALTTLDAGNHAVRDSRWRYIRYYDGSEELYDHDNDSVEWVNLATDSQYTSVKQQLASWIP